MRMPGTEHLTRQDAEACLAQGGRFVFYEVCVSLVVATLRRPSRIYLLRPGELGIWRGMPYTILSLLLGWWGIPWGIIYTPLVIITNLSGGCDVSAQVLAQVRQSPSSAAAAGTPPCSAG